MDITLNTNRNFDFELDVLKHKYGEAFEYLNGFHPTQLDFSEFINGFIDKTVADATIDGNANASHKDVVSLDSEKCKSEDKLFCFSKIYYELEKAYGLATAKEWLEYEYNGGFYLHNAPTSTKKPYCFRGDTEILTDKGIFTLESLNGQQIKVLNKNHGWEDAEVKYFGKDKIYKLTLERYGNIKDIYCTGNHLWFVKNKGKKHKLCTTDLQEGDKIPFNTSIVWRAVIPSPFGVAHGFFTGDGYKCDKPRANFCGEKTALIPYFIPGSITGNEREYTSFSIPKYFNNLPSLSETPSYLYGWLSGYFAADGSIDEKGRCVIASVQRENLEFVRNVLCVLGMPVNEIRSQTRISNLTNEESTIYILTLSTEYLKDDFFILPKHKQRFEDYIDRNNRKDRSWKVVSVEDTGEIDDVYCAVAEKTHSFTLSGNVLTHNCFAYDLTRLATEGLFFLDNYNNKPAEHLTTFFDDVIEFISFYCNRSSGAVGLPNVLIWSFYFWKKDVSDNYYILNPEYYIRQNFQKFIYRLNQPFMRVDQSAFVNVSIFDRNYIEALFGGVVYPDGSMVIDYVDEIIEHQKIFMEVVSKIREENMFTFPVLTYSLLYQNDKFVDEEFARWCSDHNMKWNDSNFFVSDNVGTLSNCCRLLSDTTKLDAFINSIGGTALSIGSVQVNTINLMHIFYETAELADHDGFIQTGMNDSIEDVPKHIMESIYIKKLTKATQLCCKVLDVIRHIIFRNIQKGLLASVYTDGGIEMEKQYCTVGMLGLYEVIEAFGYTQVDDFGNISYTDDGIRFAEKIFETINNIKDNFTHDYSFNLESVPAERAAVILCSKDNYLYNKKDKFIYSNQWIPLTAKCTIDEKLRLSSLLDKKCGGGAIAHINIEANFPNEEVAWEMLNETARRGVIYFAWNTRINVCEDRHAFLKSNTCPHCGKPVYDTYQRIVGFLVPSKAYSKERFKEFSARKWYSYAQMKGEIL
jgi:ribonucleoside-triphosphate reductase